MKWDEEADLDDPDEDDNIEFERLRGVRNIHSLYFMRNSKILQELRSFLDSILVIDADLVTDAVQRLALKTITAYTNHTPMKWNEAELGVYLVYLFGEVNKCQYSSISYHNNYSWDLLVGGKGRAAFCQVSVVIDRERRKDVDYLAFPLTPHGEMLFGLVQSGIAGYPHRAVALQFFETVVRYPDFFKVRKSCIIPVLEAMIDSRFVIVVRDST